MLESPLENDRKRQKVSPRKKAVSTLYQGTNEDKKIDTSDDDDDNNIGKTNNKTNNKLKDNNNNNKAKQNKNKKTKSTKKPTKQQSKSIENKKKTVNVTFEEEEEEVEYVPVDTTHLVVSHSSVSVTRERTICCRSPNTSGSYERGTSKGDYRKNDKWVKAFRSMIAKLTNVHSIMSYIPLYLKPEYPKIHLLSIQRFTKFASTFTNGSIDMDDDKMKTFYAELPTTIPQEKWHLGIYGVTPVKLLYLTYRDLHCSIGPNPSQGLYNLPWKPILTWDESQIDQDATKKHNQPLKAFGSYAMLHWKNRQFATGIDLDVKKIGMEYVSKELLDELEDFAFNIIRFLLPEEFSAKTNDEIREHFRVFPGFVITSKAYHQHMHQDERSNHHIFIVHLALCREGLFLRIALDKKHRNDKDFLKIHVPFGSFIVLPADVYHSGVYGSPGNYRLHIAIRSVKSKWDNDHLFPLSKEDKKPTEDLNNNNVNWSSWAVTSRKLFGYRYETMLLRNCNVWYRTMFATPQAKFIEAVDLESDSESD